jgi:hypothetical protein
MKKLYILLFILGLNSGLLAQFVYQGSVSLMNTQTGRVFEPGRVEIGTNLSFFTKLTEYLGDNNVTASNFGAANYWLVTNNFKLSLGLFNNFDLTIAPRIYQDNHYASEYNLPGDIFLSLKAGNIAFASRRMYFATMLNFRFGTGDQHNYPFAEFASGGLEYGIGTALSYYSDPYLPDRSFSAHLNLAWYNHNEAGETQYKLSNGDELIAQVNSSELQYGLGFTYPIDLFEFRLEVNGINYLTQPDTMVYSRENYTYVTPSFRYKALDWISIDLGAQIRISGDEEETKGINNYANLDLPNYSSWRAVLGINLKLLPVGRATDTPETIERKKFNKRIDFFQNIIEEREKAEDVQEELDKLQVEREEAEKELEELKQILEEQG